MRASGLTFGEVAELVGNTTAMQRPSRLLTRVSAFGDAGEDSVVFAGDEEALTGALASAAGLILTRLSFDGSRDDRIVGVADPRFAFAQCARRLAALANSDTAKIHPSAQVHATAKLGTRVCVGAGAVIEAEARLGDDASIGSNAVICEGVVLGNRVVVQSGTVLGARGFGYVRNAANGEYLLFPQQGSLVIEDDVEIGANCTVDRGALEETRIGRGTKIDNLVHIGHNCRIGKNVIIAAQVGISGSCVVEDGAVLAGQVGISDHCHIGPGVILGGQAGVYRGKTVTGPGEIFAGTPAEPLRDQMRSLARLRRIR